MARQGLFDGGVDAPVVRLSTDDGLGFLEWLAGETNEHCRHGTHVEPVRQLLGGEELLRVVPLLEREPKALAFRPDGSADLQEHLFFAYILCAFEEGAKEHLVQLVEPAFSAGVLGGSGAGTGDRRSVMLRDPAIG